MDLGTESISSIDTSDSIPFENASLAYWPEVTWTIQDSFNRVRNWIPIYRELFIKFKRL